MQICPNNGQLISTRLKINNDEHVRMYAHSTHSRVSAIYEHISLLSVLSEIIEDISVIRDISYTNAEKTKN